MNFAGVFSCFSSTYLKSYELVGWDLGSSTYEGDEVEYPDFGILAEQLERLIDDTDYKYQDLQCSLTKNVIKDIYMNFRDLYNELDNDSEVIK